MAGKSVKPTKEILHELAHDAQKAGSTLREKVVLATQTVANRIDNLGEKLPDKTELITEESKVLGQRMLIMARASTNNARGNTKTACYNANKGKNRS